MKIANVAQSACIATGISDLSAPTIVRAEREARREREGAVVRHMSGFKAKPGVVGNGRLLRFLLTVELPNGPRSRSSKFSLEPTEVSFLNSLSWELHKVPSHAACTFIDRPVRNHSEYTSIRIGPSPNRRPWAENEKWSQGRPDDSIEEDPAHASTVSSSLQSLSYLSSLPRRRVRTRAIARLMSRLCFRSDGAGEIHPFEPSIQP